MSRYNLPEKINVGLQSLQSLALQIHQAQSLEIAFTLTVQTVRDLLRSDRTILYQFLSDSDGIILAESVEPGWLPLQGQLIYDPCFLNQWQARYQQGQVNVNPDVTSSGRPPCYLNLMARLQVQANLVVPVLLPHSDPPMLWGLLIAHQCQGPRQWQSDDIQLLEFVAFQLAIALQTWDFKHQIKDSHQDGTGVTLQQALSYQAEREQMVYAIAQHIRQSLDLEQILNTTVTDVRHFLQADRVVIFQFRPDWSGVVVTESVAPDCLSILHQEIRDTYFAEHHGQLMQNRVIRATENIYTDGLNPCHIEFLEQLQVKAKLVVPINTGQQLWGLLVVHQCTDFRTWQPQEVDLLMQLSLQVAIAIQQSELHQQLQHLNSHLESQVQERTAQLSQSLAFEALLKRITDSVRDSLDEQHILQSAVQELARGLNTICCDTGIYNAEQTHSTIAYECNHALWPAAGKTFALKDASHAEVYPQLLQGVICQFCDRIPNTLRTEQTLLVVLACPIMDDQGVLGDLWLFKATEQSFDDLEVRLVQQVANQCAIALRQSRLYQATQIQVQELERLNQLKDDFLSTVSHELRTPISSMNLAIQMLQVCLHPLEQFGAKTEVLSHYLQILQTECQREINLVNDLLDFTRFNTRTEPLQLVPLHLQFWLPHIAEPFLESLQRQQQHLDIAIAEDLPALTTDIFYLERVVTELLQNACKYTPAGGTIVVTAELATLSPPLVLIQVRNSGVEIPATEHERIFEKFYRIPNGDPWKYGGTGLGLALVKKLLELLQGQIEVMSAANWTTFSIYLPLDLGDPPEAPPERGSMVDIGDDT